MRYSLFAIRYSLFAIRYSLFAIRYSLFAIRYSLFAIHKYLFQDVYDWTGEARKVEFSKAGRKFFPVSHFANAIGYINTQLSEYTSIADSSKENLSTKLAKILDTVNFLHPFREGNGRAQREFIRSLALTEGWEIGLNKPDRQNIYLMYLSSTINCDINIIATMFS
ncbi:MAG: Fic family protein [Deltaproteobacteria bacterium]|nr:Fic family protein [Deltaproteobacteria bacterium]